jgi:hypothetical protein
MAVHSDYCYDTNNAAMAVYYTRVYDVEDAS